MNDDLDVLTRGAVAIEGDSIVEVGLVDEVVTHHPGADRDDLGAVVLMPGLINAHHHSGMLRGTAESLPVWEWLRLHIDPMHRVLRADEAEASAWLCYAEGILGGTTTVVDMWRFMDGAARAAETLGNRLVSVNYTGHHPDYDYFDSLDDNERMLRDWTGAAGGRIIPFVGLESPFYADEKGLARAIAMAKDYDTALYTHISESSIEVDEFDRRYGKRPMFALDSIGWFEAPRAVFAHAVWLDQAEIDFVKDLPVGISHNPVSNMKLASGMAPVADFLAAGIAVGLGTDGEKENNNLDMFEELKTASLLGKLRTMDAAAMGSWDVLTMATSGGARAIGQGDRLGSLMAGKQADLIAVRSNTPRMTPLIGEGPYANIHHNLVHAVRGSDVSMTMVAGAEIARDGLLANADLAELIARVRSLVPGLFERRSAWLASVKEPEGLFGA